MTKPAALLRAILTIPCALALASCGASSTRIARLPAELTACADEPTPPDLPGYDWQGIEATAAQQPTPAAAARTAVGLAKVQALVRDRLMLDFTLAQSAAGGDCRAKVNGAAAWNRSVGDK